MVPYRRTLTCLPVLLKIAILAQNNSKWMLYFFKPPLLLISSDRIDDQSHLYQVSYNLALTKCPFLRAGVNGQESLLFLY